MADYSRQIESAHRMMGAKGVDIEITRQDQEYEPDIGQMLAKNVVKQTLKAVNLPSTAGRIQSFDNRLLEEASLIGKKLRYFLVSAKGAKFQPERGDELTYGGEAYAVIGSTPLSPNGQDILYKVAASR